MNEKFSDERISAYLDDELAADVRAEVERELAENPELRQAVDELHVLRAGLQSLPRYRLESNIAERVLELAEREILTGRPAEASSSGEARCVGGASKDDLRPQPALQSNAPISKRESSFSWRNLAWSATAAGVAAVLTNYYHVSIRPDANPESRVAKADEAPASRSKGSLKQVSPGRGDTAAGVRAAGVEGQAEESTLAAEDAPAPTARRQSVAALAPASAAGIGAVTADSAAAGDAVANDSNFADPVLDTKVGGAGGQRPDADADGDLAKSPKDGSNGGASLRGGGAGRGQYRQQRQRTEFAATDMPVSLVVLSVSPEAMRDHSFDRVLKLHRVVLLDDVQSAGDVAGRAASGTNGAGNAGEQADRKDDGEIDATDAASKPAVAPPTVAATDALGLEMVEVVATRQQFAEILATVDRSGNEFAVLREFTAEDRIEPRDRAAEANAGQAGFAGAESRSAAASKTDDESAADQPSLHQESGERGRRTLPRPEPPSSTAKDRAVKEGPAENRVAENVADKTPAPNAAVGPAADKPAAAPPRESSPSAARRATGNDSAASKRGATDKKSADGKALPSDPASAPDDDASRGEAAQGDRAKGDSAAGGRSVAKSQIDPSSPVAEPRPASPTRSVQIQPRGMLRDEVDDEREVKTAETAELGGPEPESFARRVPSRGLDELLQRHGASRAVPEAPGDRARAPSEIRAEKSTGQAAPRSLAEAPRVRILFLLQPAIVTPGAAATAEAAETPAVAAPSDAAPTAPAADASPD
ncbi:MAG: hypothetical protein WD875_06120 [Pirellulales bacterium]